MIFTSKRIGLDPIDINIDGHSIDKVMSTKFLGVYIDNKLNWKRHIDHVCGKVSRGLGIILKARQLLTRNSLKTLYYSFIYPYFTYCNHVWGSTYPTTLNPLFLRQKRAIRIIAGAKFLDHTDPLFCSLNLLKLHDINTFVISKFMYKWYHCKLPVVFRNTFTLVSDTHNHNTRNSYHLRPISIKTNLGKSRYQYRAPNIWNSIMKSKVNPDVSEAVFVKSIKHCIKVG